MKNNLLGFFLLFSASLFAQKNAPAPPLGWNSYNCFGATVEEKEVKANADYMAEKLKKHGWQYVVVDFCWSYPHPPGSTQSPPPQFRTVMDNAPVPWLGMDENGRLLPDLRKFPSAAGGVGFKPLADYVHSLGLKFGIHIMRGIPRQAVWAKSKILKTNGLTAADIVDTTSVCPWLNNMWGVNMDKPGAQEYYNSMLDLYASWGVDFVKMDDVDGDPGYPYRSSEVAAVRKAIAQCGRPIVLSLSLNLKFENREHVAANAEMWRISMDFWDNWAQLEKQFDHCAEWQNFAKPGAFPDADMLQIGRLSKRGPVGEPRWSLLTDDEILTHFTLWTIFRSPLMFGGNMPENTPFIENLLTNDEVLTVNQKGFEARQVFKKDETAVWISKNPGSDDLNLAVFNLSKNEKTVAVPLADLGLKKGKFQVRDLWEKKDLGTFSGELSAEVNTHGVRLFRVSKK